MMVKKTATKKSMNNKLRRLSKEFKNSPSPKVPSHSNKPLIIGIITVVAVIGLSLLLLNADRLVGKAYSKSPQPSSQQYEPAPSNREYQVSSANCGDGAMNSGESCDDHNKISGDGCSSSCQIESGYECTKAVCTVFKSQSPYDCAQGTPSQCTKLCGNGELNSGEQCDDGNTNNGDGCTSQCQPEQANVCGNGVVEQGEQCDDGAKCDVQNPPFNSCVVGATETKDCSEYEANNLFPECVPKSNDGCSDQCTLEQPNSCGNGILEESNNEQCDDGNIVPGDGCDASCQMEFVDLDFDGVNDADEPQACQNVGDSNTVNTQGTFAGCLYGDVGTPDGCVDLADIAIVASNVDLNCQPQGSKTAADGDVNGDGCVNLQDIALIAANVDLQCGGQ